jgi:hypothetical protein
MKTDRKLCHTAGMAAIAPVPLRPLLSLPRLALAILLLAGLPSVALAAPAPDPAPQAPVATPDPVPQAAPAAETPAATPPAPHSTPPVGSQAPSAAVASAPVQPTEQQPRSAHRPAAQPKAHAAGSRKRVVRRAQHTEPRVPHRRRLDVATSVVSDVRDNLLPAGAALLLVALASTSFLMLAARVRT